MTNKKYLALLLTAALAATGCNGDLDETDPNGSDVTVPDTGNNGNGGDNGGTDNGDEGGGSDNGDSGPHIGTWENPDEDGDGIPDELDDFPFDPSRGRLPTIEEEEFNNNVGQANIVGELPFRVSGVIGTPVDIDDFKFTITQEQVDSEQLISFVLFKDEAKFKPTLALIDDNGSRVDGAETAIANVGRIGKAYFFRPERAGNFNLSVSDLNSNGSSRFTYTIDAFIDNDSDGVADDIELALGMNPKLQDTDGDGIFDGNEYHVFINQTERLLDADNDGIPNWLDDDSDGDGIPDSIEGTGNQDFDYLPNFVDTDSDNDGVLDNPDDANIDSDGDGVPNYADVDDDGDLILDINDDDSTARPAYDDTLEVYGAVFTTDHGDTRANVAMAHKPLTISAKSLPNSEVIVVLNKQGNDNKPVNIKATPTDSETLEFVLPDYADIKLGGEEFDLFIVSNGKRSNDIRIKLLRNESPQLYELQPSSVAPGDTVTVTGDNLLSDIKISWGTSLVALNVTSLNTAQFVVPEDAMSGQAYLTNIYGESRYADIWVGHHMTLNVTMPNAYRNVSGPFTVGITSGDYADISAINGMDYLFEGRSPTRVSIRAEGYDRLLSAIALPSNKTINFTLDSTIQSIALTNYLTGKTEQEAIEIIALLPNIKEYQELANYIKNGVETDIKATMSLDNMDVAVKIYEIQEALDKLQQASTTTMVTPATVKKWRTAAPQRAAAMASSENNDAKIHPTITPAESQDGIKVEPTRGSIFELFSYDGYTEVQNSTQMYLSAAVYPIKADLTPDESPAIGVDPKNPGKSKTYGHIVNFVDRDMISPVAFSPFAIPLWSKDQMMQVCQFKDCMIEVITPGSNGEKLTDPAKIKVAYNIFLRNLIDRCLWKSLKTFTDIIISTKSSNGKGIDTSGYITNNGQKVMHITEVIIEVIPGVTDAIWKALDDGEISPSEMDDILHEFEEIVRKERNTLLIEKHLGPVLTAVASAVGYDLNALMTDVRNKIISEIAESLVPIYGQLEKIYAVLSTISDATNAAAAWYNLFTLDQHYDYRVTWGMHLLKMQPGLLDIEHRPPTNITVTGTGICPIDSFLGTNYPKVYLTDVTTGEYTQALTGNDAQYRVNSSCTEATFAFPEEFFAQMQPDSKVSVEFQFKDDVANSVTENTSPNYLTFGQGLAIGSTSPSPAINGGTLTIYGIGFSANISDNKVFFVDQFNNRLLAHVYTANSSKLTVEVPPNAVTGQLYVEVDNDSAMANVTINAAQMIITFGDNGNDADDSFQLTLDDTFVDASTVGERRRTKELSVTPGKATLTIEGITVPDARATYYVCFSSNVDVLSGHTSARVDFAPGTQFTTNIDININAAPASDPINCQYLNPQNPQQVKILWQE